MERRHCTNCGQLMQPDANFCASCGKPKTVTHEESAVQPLPEARGSGAPANGTCPHCRAALDPVPRRKTKCRSCGEDIYVRTHPVSREVLLLRREDALSMDVVRDSNLQSEFGEARGEAPRTETVRGTVWRLLNQRKYEATKNGDWLAMSTVSCSQARLQYLLGEDYLPLLQIAMKEVLQGESRKGVTHVQIIPARDDRTCQKCASQDGMTFSIEEALEKMPLPVKCDSEEGWCRCSYAYQTQR